MTFREGSKAKKCGLLLPQAIQEVSSEGAMKFSVRNLFYKTRELFLRAFQGESFYKEYSSFTQDFLTQYQFVYGKIRGLVSEPRGKWVSRTTYGAQTGDNDGSTAPFKANKVILIEKAGLFQVMKENEFHLRLDALIITTQGFSSEQIRNTLIELEKQGFPIFVVHDYDINGILIRTTLHEQTKRRKTSLNADTHDLGFSYDDIVELDLRERAEPVKLSKQDTRKLDGLLAREEITIDEFAFLELHRIELNALEPLRLLEWLEAKLTRLGYWKTIPEQGELDHIAEEQLDYEIASERRLLSSTIQERAFDKTTTWMEELNERVATLRSALRQASDAYCENNLARPKAPKITVETIEEYLQRRPLDYWSQPAERIASRQAEGLVKERIEDFDKVEAIDTILRDVDVVEALESLRDYIARIGLRLE